MTRRVLLVAHTGKASAVMHARRSAEHLMAAGFVVDVGSAEAAELAIDSVQAVTAAVLGTEIVLAFGGDGTVLRAAELARPAGVPLLGVNFGRMGFLTTAEVEDIAEVLDRVVRREYHAAQRLTLDVRVQRQNEMPTQPSSQWALNEVSLEHTTHSRMLEVLLRVDDQPVSRWGCDGVICATPTGSTAYAFSAGGPVIWPDTQTLLVVPNAAHALFSRPLVVSPDSTISLAVAGDALLVCDGRRSLSVYAGDVVHVKRGELPLLLAGLSRADFARRVVAKFQLPVTGWRRDAPLDPVEPTTSGSDYKNVTTTKTSGGG